MTDADRATIRMLYRQAMISIIRAINNGATPEHVANVVLHLPYEIQPRVARTIEDAAEPGSFAEAVFDILDASCL